MKPNEETKILVTSAGGKTGIPVTLGLVEKGYCVRALVRQEDARAKRLRDAGAEVRVVNLADSRDIRSAMADIDRAYFCAPTEANGLHYANVFAVEAQQAGIKHIVSLGQWLSHDSHPSLLTREIWLVEQLMNNIHGATHTNVNVGWFAANYFFVLETMAQLGMMPMPLGDGLNAPPSNEDIARVVVGALDRPDLHAGKKYRPTGPKNLSPEQIVDEISCALGRKVKYKPVSEKMLLKSLRAEGWPEVMQTQFIIYLEEYRRGVFGFGGPTNAVLEVSGQEPEDFATIARRYVQEDPVARITFRSKLRAIRKLCNAIATKPIHPINTEIQRGHALINDGLLCSDSQQWKDAYAQG
jgi:NAD(P)H dehydrogenase (quinone)